MILKQLTILFLLHWILLSIQAQDIKSLEAEKIRIQEDIARTSNLLQKYNQEKSKALTNIKLLNSQIKSREKLVDIYSTEIGWLNDDILSLQSEIQQSELELQALKKSYANLILKSYENRKIYNEVSFFLGAETFNEAYRRFIIYKEYNKFRRNQGELIHKQTKDLEEKRAILETKLNIQTTALQKVIKEKEHLIANKNKLNSSINNLKRKERQLKKQLADNQKSLQKLEKAILKLIEEATKEDYVITDFNKSFGKLTWPVGSGVIVSQFGEHQHPVLKYVKVNNNGVDILSNNGGRCTAVFEGVVSRVVTIPGYNKTVIVRHGKYLTVYANLQTVSVKKGDSVVRDSELGIIYSGEGENSNVLHFEIWEENRKLDPEKWLSN